MSFDEDDFRELGYNVITKDDGSYYTEDELRKAGAEYLKRHPELCITADAEEAKETGGMMALFPRVADAEMIAYPGFEPPEDLHVTLVYFGSDVDEVVPPEVLSAGDYAAQRFEPIEAELFAHAVFNPMGDEPCAVYLVSGTRDLTDIREMLCRDCEGVRSPEQHEPFIPHITAGYGLDVTALQYTGPVVFDRIELHWRGQRMVWPL